MSSRRAGTSRRRCRRDGLFVDGVKVPIGPGAAAVVWRDGDRVRRLTPESFRRIMKSRRGPIDVFVIPYEADFHPTWFDTTPAGLPVWQGRVHPDSNSAASRRRLRQISYWDDRNLLACTQFIAQSPDPALPEQRMLALAALAAAETRQVEFTRRRENLEAVVCAGERGRGRRRDLGVLRSLQHGTKSHPLEPTEDRRVLRRRAVRLMNHSESAAARLETAAGLDRHGAALAVASRILSVEPGKLLDGATQLAAIAVVAQVVNQVTGPEAGLWAYRTLAGLSVFARANARALSRQETEGQPADAKERERRWRQDHEILSAAAPDTLLVDATVHGARQARSTAGGPADRAAAGLEASRDRIVENVVMAATATSDIARSGQLRQILLNLSGAVAAVAVSAQTAAAVGAFVPELDPGGIELTTSLAIGSAIGVAGHNRHPGSELAKTARSVRRDFESSRRRREKRLRSEGERRALTLIIGGGDPPSVTLKAPRQESSARVA